MNFHVPEYIRAVVPYVPGKPIEETQREFKLKRVIKLASNENPLGPSPKALQAMRLALKELHRYPDGSGFHLKQALAKHLAVEPGQLILGNGSNEVIDFLVRALSVAGDTLVTSQAAFLAYKLCAQIHGVITDEVPLDAELEFSLDEMLARVRKNERAKLVFIANPNNPTGTYVKSDALRAFLREVSRVRGGSVVVALDYAYWEYVTAKDLPDPMKLVAEFPNVIALRTFSKVYGISGARVGYGVGNSELVSSLEKVRQPFNINSLGLAGARAALSDRSYVKRARQTNSAGMKFWEKELAGLGIPFWKSQGNFILVDAAAGFGRAPSEIYQECLKRGVILRPVGNYGLKQALRISVGTPAENRFAIAVLKAVKKALK